MEKTREELYQLVWSTPLKKLGSEFDVSGQTLANICRRFDIPVPPVGYWQKLAFGKAVERPELPTEETEGGLIVSLSPKLARPALAKRPVEVREIEPTAVENSRTAPPPHPIVASIRKRLAKIKWHEDFVTISVPPFKITTSPGPIGRICDLVGQLVREIQEQGWILQKRDTAAWRLVIQEEEILISLQEQTDRVAHIPTKQELRDAAEYSWRKIPEFDHVPSGLLKLTLTNASYLGLRVNWADGKKQRLETTMPSILEGLAGAGSALHARRLEREEQARQYAMWEKREAERKRSEQIQFARVGELRILARRHREASELRAFITAVQTFVAQSPECERSAAEEWLIWAEHAVVGLDPLGSGPPHLLSEHDA
ncbi:hypothetical protein G6M84_06995 [Agrobacterium tumefaciens]|uniref:hypothetical protein n=1 Tax=Agrobacterium tumefaciens TaxID=358 RepID=UPI001572B724|nr:hypothetical protein [Agrobacterium tumefaciens]NTB96258.1 hypothetical protein [Agrobacterium tumefaciens]NTC46783.1 hypothetical protein [Agrobacterium tumefaciens]